MKTASRYLMVAVLASSLGACSNMSDTEKRTLGGAGIGAASGALIGELATGQPLHGAAIGAAVGAAGGWLYDRHKRSE
jgi:uncharacterized membrane protein